MSRRQSTINPQWWDYTTLDPKILEDAAKISVTDIEQLQRPGFKVTIFDSIEEFFVAEAMEYIRVWQDSTPDNPKGICGPIGPTEHLPLVARIVNDMEIDVRSGFFWGMDEWYIDGKEAPVDHPLSFARADLELCFSRIKPELRMPNSHLRFPTAEGLADYSSSYDDVRCMVMQGGQGEVKHWAFNDPPKREGANIDVPPSPEEYRKLPARIVDLHPMTLIQNARTSYSGRVHDVPVQALSVGPVETWKSDCVSIWHPGQHDNPFGMRLTSLMISKGLPDTSVPMSLLADHPNVHFHFLRSAIGTTDSEMH